MFSKHDPCSPESTARAKTPAAVRIYKQAAQELTEHASSSSSGAGPLSAPAQHLRSRLALHLDVSINMHGFMPEEPRELFSMPCMSEQRSMWPSSSPQQPMRSMRSTSLPLLPTRSKVASSSSAPGKVADISLVVEAAKMRNANAQQISENAEPTHKNANARALWRKAHVLTKLDTTMRKPRLRNDMPDWWRESPPKLVVEAANNFDQRHRANCARAERLQLAVENDTLLDDSLREAVFEVTSTRYFTNEPAELVIFKAQRRERVEDGDVNRLVEAFVAPTFDVYKSIWGPRCKFADSKDVYDNDETDMKRFKNDWERCLQLGVAQLITRHDDDPGADEDGDGIPDEVVEVGTVLWQNHDAVCLIFSYYASMGGSSILTIGLNQWTQFLVDFKLVQKKSKYCKKSDMDRVFIAVDTASAKLEAQNAFISKTQGPSNDEKQKELNRVEFITCLANIAINRYILPGVMNDVSEALKRLLELDIQARMRPNLLADPNVFREAHCYIASTSEYLRCKERSLRNLFLVLAGGGRGAETTLLDLSEWKDFMRAVDLIAADVTERDATLAFVWSRTAVIDGRTIAGHRKEGNLPFEGFLEALCRLACMKSLPTEDEIQESGCKDSAEYLERLREADRPAYEALLVERATPWGETPPQPVEYCVAQLVTIFIREIEKQCGDGPGNGEIDTKEAAKFWKSRSRA